MAANSKQKRGRRKAAWDSTVRDLTGLKLSDKELEQRRQLFRSKNIEKARKELYDKPSHTLSKTSKENSTSNRQTLRELLQEAQESLDRVQGLSMTSDSLKRYNVNPMITPAPITVTTVDCNKENIVGNATPDDGDNRDGMTVSDPPPCTTTSYQIYNEPHPLHAYNEPHPLESDNTTEQVTDIRRDDNSVLAESVRKLEIMVEELMHNNRILTETIFEQQATIDILSQDLIYLKEHSEKLEKTVSDRINGGLIVPHPLWPHPPIHSVVDGVRDSSANNETFVSLPTLKHNEHNKN